MQISSKATRALPHGRIFQNRRAIAAVQKFTDKSPADIILINRPKGTWNEPSKPGQHSGRVYIAGDDAGAENCQPLETYFPHCVFFLPHDSGIANPALRTTAGSGKKSESFDAPRKATACKCADQTDFQLFDIFFAPFLTPFADANAAIRSGAGPYSGTR